MASDADVTRPETDERAGESKNLVLDGATTLWRFARRVTATARNAAEVARFGGLETGEQPSPYVVVADFRNGRLRHYFPDDVGTGRTPILLVPPLMITSEVWDVSPNSSAVASLHASGIDPWVVDFGRPDREPGGLERNLTDHVLAVDEATGRVREETGRDVVLAGYSQGGMFSYQTAAYRRGEGIDSIVTFGSPVDTRAPLPFPISPEVAARLAGGLVDSGLARHLTVPGWAARLGFKMLAPAKSVQARVRFLLQLHDRESLLPRERQRRFLDSEGWTAWAGPAFAEMLEQFIAHNRMLEGGFTIGDRLVTLADIEVPVLTVVGDVDSIGHPQSVRAIRMAAPRSDVYELTLHAGHFGLVVGSTANDHSWPGVVDWVHWREGTAALPSAIRPAEAVEPGPVSAAGTVQRTADLGIDAGRAIVGAANQAARAVRSLVREAPAQLPRLARLHQMSPQTRISLGLLLDEQARKSPADICFLFGDRAQRQYDVKYRVDSVARGLISVGIRHGDRVGVLMETRPSAFTVVAALSRLGATAVLLRPEGDLAREAWLSRISWVVADPEHIDSSAIVGGVTRCVLGGGASPRELPADVVDIERIDPDEVAMPAWYRANPHRAGDVAFVFFSGEGAHIRAVTITNRRWALSALGTASAAALRIGDTVYCVTPIHHSSALLMSVGGAIAGGARFAMATADDPDTFWDEVRRYGVTHVSYTWTSLRAITYAPRNRNERHHPIRMFIGSGIPRNLWRRVAERFPSARVLEFYASAEGEAILADLTGSKPGCMGRPLPATAEVRVVGYDVERRRLELGDDGLARECDVDEVGLLLARVAHPETSQAVPLRGVFAGDDAWQSTGDLFRRDERGDLWLVDPVESLILTPRGPVAPSGVRDALGSLPAVDLAVAYGVPAEGGDLVVAAVTLRADAKLTTAELDAELLRLPEARRPSYVQVLRDVPLTTWHRPAWRPLQAKGIPSPSDVEALWRLADDGAHYLPLG